MSKTINWIKATKITFSRGYRPGASEKSDAGPVQYNPWNNSINMYQFPDYWFDASYTPVMQIWHELGHAKAYILGRIALKYGFTVQDFPVDISTIYLDINKYQHCFPTLKVQSKVHGKMIAEFYGYLQNVFGLLGRSYLTKEDIEIVFRYKGQGTKKRLPLIKGKINTEAPEIKKWEETIKNGWGLKRGDVAYVINQLATEIIWDEFDFRKCHYTHLLHLLNDIAKLDIKRMPTQQSKVVSEGLLDVIEETMDAAPFSQMFGTVPVGYHTGERRFNDGECEPEDEDCEEAELEEISAVAGAAVEITSEPGKRDGLIREVEDYLFKIMGANE